MAKILSNDIRNICLVGHSGDGKTSFAEAMLYLAKITDRLGKPADGNTVCDFDPEEIKRGYSISSSLVNIEWNGKKINILDAPGMFGFAGEAKAAAAVAASTVIVVDAKSGCKVGTELAWEYSAGKPKAFFVNKIDDEHSNFEKTFSGLREQFGTSVCPLLIPFNEGTGAVGLYNLINDTVFTCEKKTGKRIETTLPAEYQSKIDSYKEALVESLALTSEELMEKFLMEEPFTEEEKHEALNRGLLSGDIAPVFCGSSTDMAGIRFFLDTAAASFVSPLDMMKNADPEGETRLFVFKVLADNFGKKVFFKVMNGTLKKDQILNNITTGQQEKFTKICTCIGKKEIEVDELVTGDIGYAVKLVNTGVNDTLCSGTCDEYTKIEFPSPYYTMAIKPTSKNDEDKLSTGITKLLEEDPTLRFANNAETKQLTVSGMGDIHLDVVCAKLKSRYGVGTELIEPKIAYREAIKKSVSVEGKHKKQSGGSGQYGHVKITFSPGEEDGLTFTQSVVGGNVPKNFYPAVEKGLQEAMLKGVLAGFPMANLKADLFDGSYHPVDSNEISFKLAAKLAFKEGLPKANPVILEPVGYLKCTIPTSYSGDIMGDVSKRRGRIMGMSESTRKGYTVIEAEIPSAEMTVYAVQLRAMTQGRGTYTFDFVRYEEAPAEVAQKIIAEAKQDEEE